MKNKMRLKKTVPNKNHKIKKIIKHKFNSNKINKIINKFSKNQN